MTLVNTVVRGTDADRLLFQRYNHPTPPQRMSGRVGSQAAGPTAGFKLD